MWRDCWRRIHKCGHLQCAWLAAASAPTPKEPSYFCLWPRPSRELPPLTGSRNAGRLLARLFWRGDCFVRSSNSETCADGRSGRPRPLAVPHLFTTLTRSHNEDSVRYTWSGYSAPRRCGSRSSFASHAHCGRSPYQHALEDDVTCVPSPCHSLTQPRQHAPRAARAYPETFKSITPSCSLPAPSLDPCCATTRVAAGNGNSGRVVWKEETIGADPASYTCSSRCVASPLTF